jgi:hypothetical protein
MGHHIGKTHRHGDHGLTDFVEGSAATEPIPPEKYRIRRSTALSVARRRTNPPGESANSEKTA